MRKLLAAFLAASAVALILVGLVAAATLAPGKASATKSRTGAAAKGTVSVALIGDPGKLDPQQTAGTWLWRSPSTATTRSCTSCPAASSSRAWRRSGRCSR